MSTDVVRGLWRSRAANRAVFQPTASVGARSEGWVLLPRVGGSLSNVDVGIFGNDVPASGNCLYHAVWSSAVLAGVQHPFGAEASDHVFGVRVKVAIEVVRLLDEGRVVDVLGKGSLHAGDLVAMPNQFRECSGVIPLTAMAHLLGRPIVVISADGIFGVYSDGVGLRDGVVPIAICHCAAGRVTERVTFGERNHYIAVFFSTRAVELAFAEAVRNWAGVSEVALGQSVPGGLNRRKRPSVEPERKGKKKIRGASGVVGAEDDRDVLNLIARATGIQSLTKAELGLLGRHFLEHPQLALLYFHCCANDPDANVFNNETLNGPHSERTVARLNRVLDDPVSAADISNCQERAAKNAGDAGNLWACASCCEMLNTVEDDVRFVALSDLHHNFQLTAAETREASCLGKVAEHIQVFRLGEVSYHLNPDLVRDHHSVPLCARCAVDPRKASYSIASGHDYGRRGDLPELNDVASKCISPVRSYGLAITASGKHSIGHSICFPSTGPAEVSNILPCTSRECIPSVTFVGPREDWRVKRKRYRNLYRIPVDETYAWMRVLAKIHSYFKDHCIQIDESVAARAALTQLEATIEASVEITMSKEALAVEDGMLSERYGAEYVCTPADDGEELVAKTAALRGVDAFDLSLGGVAVDAMLDILDGQTNAAADTSPVVIRRGPDPLTEWTENGEMLAAAFPLLFMRGGKCLPCGTWPASLTRHLMRYYDGRFEKDTRFVATLFNQLQRHAAVRRAARVGSSRASVLVRLGTLSNSEDFRSLLLRAQQDPESPAAKRVNAYLLRILSLVGGGVPFSPFERAATRPKIGALRARYGVPQHWVTVAPPEHHDLELHRIAQLRANNAWNDPENVFSRSSCQQSDLPEQVRSTARQRLLISNTYPGLSARVFERRVRQIYDDIILCKRAEDTRLSRDYSQRQPGAYGAVAAHAAVIEPQVDGRLHIHMCIYGLSFTPQLLSRIACSEGLRRRASQWLESVCCTQFDDSVHEQRQRWKAEGLAPKAFELPVPDALKDRDGFLLAAQKRAAVTNFHSHTSTCFKGRRGKYMCRLARPAGIHEQATCPLIVTRDRTGDMKKGVYPIVTGHDLPPRLCQAIDEGYSTQRGECFRPHDEGPVLWELTRSRRDCSVVETNLVLAALTGSHTNSSVINGESSGDMVEEYQESYMTKDDVALKGAATALLSAIQHEKRFPSRAEDSKTGLRIGKYLAVRTVNSFFGAHEWSHALMVYAIMGHRSFISSDSFWYIFPFDLMRFAAELREVSETETAIDDSHRSAEDVLAELVNQVNEDDCYARTDKFKRVGGGARAFSVAGKTVFLTQARSYHNRGHHFADFSPVEFECIVDVLPIKAARGSDLSGPGRPARTGFPFAPSHPLFRTHSGYIRAKMLTPVLGGAPPPTWTNMTGEEKCLKKRDVLARYLLCAFTPWLQDGPGWSYDASGILELCDAWDRSDAPLINRQRCRHIRNVMKKGYRSSSNERVASDWRNRGVDYWKKPRDATPSVSPTGAETPDFEFDGMLPNDTDTYALLVRAAAGSPKRRANIAAMTNTFLAVMGGRDEQSTISPASRASWTLPVFLGNPVDRDGDHSMTSVASQLRNYHAPRPDTTPDQPSEGGSGTLEGPVLIAPCQLSNEQYAVVVRVMSGVDEGRQTLTLAHGGGGTGKSFVVRRLRDEIYGRQYEIVSTCPTGAGACQLTGGMTFHSALKHATSRKQRRLSPAAAAFLRRLFNPSVVLVVVDEVSMLEAILLVVLDQRLREIYCPEKVFGGKSVLLTGDFWQLPVVGGVSLCKCLYMRISDPSLVRAKYLFSLFKVILLQTQLRASGCVGQQVLLEKFRRLPDVYPAKNRWSSADDAFRPVDDDMIASLTRPLTHEDIANEGAWLDNSVILVTGNLDRVVLNGCMAKVLSTRERQLLFRWRKPLAGDIPDSVAELIYREDEFPELFGYFFCGAPGQILDNGNGNVELGVANGTKCWLHSLGWEDAAITAEVLRLAKEALRSNQAIVDLPHPPEFINVRLADRDGNELDGSIWPPDMNLESEWVTDAHGNRVHKKCVVVPIGTAHSKDFCVKMTGLDGESSMIRYLQHAVDLAMVLTVWKAQGSTFDRVILLLEGSTTAPSWEFEHVYVAMSRIRALDSLRCFQPSPDFNIKKLRKLRPSVFTVKWLMDLDASGQWHPRT